MKVLSLIVVGILIGLSGCVKPPRYDPPPPPTFKENNVIVINKSFEEVWTALIDYASFSFFAIDNFEKASGLMTLDFGAEDPDKFVDCGIIYPSYDSVLEGPLEGLSRASLDGRMNLFVKSISENVTEVRVTARYIVTIYSQIWSFDTGDSDAKKWRTVENEVICQPTHLAEENVLQAIEKISKGLPVN